MPKRIGFAVLLALAAALPRGRGVRRRRRRGSRRGSGRGRALRAERIGTVRYGHARAGRGGSDHRDARARTRRTFRTPSTSTKARARSSIRSPHFRSRTSRTARPRRRWTCPSRTSRAASTRSTPTPRRRTSRPTSPAETSPRHREGRGAASLPLRRSEGDACLRRRRRGARRAPPSPSRVRSRCAGSLASPRRSA